MASTQRVPATGGSGLEYTFEVYPIATRFPDIGTVYIFTKREGNGYTALYIGQTAELGTRIATHEQWGCVSLHGVDSICIYRMNNEATRRRIESDLLAGIQTPCNSNA